MNWDKVRVIKFVPKCNYVCIFLSRLCSNWFCSEALYMRLCRIKVRLCGSAAKNKNRAEAHFTTILFESYISSRIRVVPIFRAILVVSNSSRPKHLSHCSLTSELTLAESSTLIFPTASPILCIASGSLFGSSPLFAFLKSSMILFTTASSKWSPPRSGSPAALQTWWGHLTWMSR